MRSEEEIYATAKVLLEESARLKEQHAKLSRSRRNSVALNEMTMKRLQVHGALRALSWALGKSEKPLIEYLTKGEKTK